MREHDYQEIALEFDARKGTLLPDLKELSTAVKYKRLFGRAQSSEQ